MRSAPHSLNGHARAGLGTRIEHADPDPVIARKEQIAHALYAAVWGELTVKDAKVLFHLPACPEDVNPEVFTRARLRAAELLG